MKSMPRLLRRERHGVNPGSNRVHDPVVLGTNVVVSALLQRRGPPAHVLLLALDGAIQFCLTGAVYSDYEEF
jgi:hypothetical protein